MLVIVLDIYQKNIKEIQQLLQTSMNKLLLMGNSGVGKTSMHSIIFSNVSPFQTSKIGYTVGKNQLNVKLFGNISINLWDCGGHQTFMIDYFTTHLQTIFKNVKILVYVFDISESDVIFKKSSQSWRKAIQSLTAYSTEALVCVIFNKTDKVKPQQLKAVSLQKQGIVNLELQSLKIKNFLIQFTTIQDFSLYSCWSKIVRFLIQEDYGDLFNKKIIKPLKQCSQNQQILILEKRSLLVLASSYFLQNYQHQNNQKLLKQQDTFSLIIKNFIFCLRKTKFIMKEFEICSRGSIIFMTSFSENFYLLIINKSSQNLKNQVQGRKLNKLNIKMAQKCFNYYTKSQTNQKLDRKRKPKIIF